MWMSKLVLNPASKAARRDLANPYEMHRTLSRAVAPALEKNGERLLWRLEPTRGHELPVVLVQTITEPDWNFLEEGYATVYPPKSFEPNFREGQTFYFRLRANPVKRVAVTGKRVALKTREEKTAWLQRRLAQDGFSLLAHGNSLAVSILQDSFLQVRRQRTGEEGHIVRIQAVLFEGRVQVCDPEKARITVARGVGPGKALGLGLLSLAP